MTFELRSHPADAGKPRLFLLQSPGRTDFFPVVDAPLSIGRVEGQTATPILTSFAEALGLSNEDAVAFLRSSSIRPVPEAVAVRLLLVGAATVGMRSAEKVRAVADHLATMPQDEVLIWQGRVLRETDAARAENARRALVVLCTGAF